MLSNDPAFPAAGLIRADHGCPEGSQGSRLLADLMAGQTYYIVAGHPHGNWDQCASRIATVEYVFVDCDGDGVSDGDAIAAGAADVNTNGIPDTCEC